MAIIQWSDRWNWGISTIDNQHKHLVKVINDLHRAVSAGVGVEAVNKTLADLSAYIELHFSHEESLMLKYRYSGYAKHLAIHKAIRAKCAELKTKAESGRAVVTVELLNFLSNWLTEHLSKVDKLVGETIKSQMSDKYAA